MIGLLKRFARDRRGVAAIELALITPVIAGLAYIGFETWRYTSEIQEMKDAVRAGVQYYMDGGKDDADGKAVVEGAWSSPPADAAVIISRACQCGAEAHVCTTLCSDSTVPEIRVTLSASATYDNARFPTDLAAEQVIRVR